MPIFLGNHLISLQSVDSTNTFAQQLLNEKKAFDGTVITAKKQISGRGQRGTSWVSEPNTNLLFTFILKDNATPVQHQFYFNMAISVGIVNFLKSKISKHHSIAIKWPNDILINTNKIAGILIENTISGSFISNSIIGIGLNVNQMNFPFFDGRKPTSLAILENKIFDLQTCLHQLLSSIEQQVMNFRNGKLNEIYVEYIQLLYRRNIPTEFLFRDEKIVATVMDVRKYGKLMVEIENKIMECDLKEITFLE